MHLCELLEENIMGRIAPGSIITETAPVVELDLFCAGI
jgi:hypothetical protein